MGKNVTIVGAGLVGSLVSIYLAKKGYKIDVYERRADMRKISMSAGRSINLALSDRGWKGLEGVGIADEIKKSLFQCTVALFIIKMEQLFISLMVKIIKLFILYPEPK